MDTLDLVVVGAGAAGLMTSIQAARYRQTVSLGAAKGRSIHLFDSRKKVGAKILISGGTRCNVTNVEVKPSDYFGGARHFIRHVFEAFTPDETIRFFKEIGVELSLESSGKYFPVTGSGRTVLEALLRESARTGVVMETPFRIGRIRRREDYFECTAVHGEGEGKNTSFCARKVVLCTGGLSLPETGSDGTGFQIARSLGHTIIPTAPALTPLTTQDTLWPSLSGVSLEARLDFYLKGKKTAQARGALLFTHNGFSGPAALDISRHYAVADANAEPRIKACFLPASNEETLRNSLKVISDTPGGLFRFMTERQALPKRFAQSLIEKCGWTGRNHLPVGWRAKFVQSLMNYSLEVSGVVGYKKAEVTAGGVSLKEVNVATMESKMVKGLYFAGEILDVDGRIGGFNFQWSWSSGAIAGRSAMKSF